MMGVCERCTVPLFPAFKLGVCILQTYSIFNTTRDKCAVLVILEVSHPPLIVAFYLVALVASRATVPPHCLE